MGHGLLPNYALNCMLSVFVICVTRLQFGVSVDEQSWVVASCWPTGFAQILSV